MTETTLSARDPRPVPDVILPADNPFLQGNFGPVEGETDAGELKVRGSLPRALSGQLLRNGPNPTDPGPDHHWFQGDAMIHGVRIEDGRAVGYRNRYIRTTRIEETLGLEAAPISAHQPLMQGGGNVHVIWHAGKILALSEVGLPYELDAELGTVGQYDFAGKLSSSMTAHPKIDPDTGELVFFGYDFFDVKLRYHVADATGALVHSVDIDKPTATMMHDFGVTASRVIHMDLPVIFDLKMVERGRSLPFRWSDEHPARLGVMPRRGGSDDVRWLEIDPCYVFHPLNAYDDGARIVMDVVRYDRTFVDGQIALEETPGRLVRWTIDPDAGSVDSDTIDADGQEFPRVDPRVEGRRHRYGYAVSVADDPARGFDGLIKHDVEAGTRQAHMFGGGRAPGEGVFVPVGDGEDEGYLLSVVYDPSSDRSEVVVLDAQRFTDDPVAVIELPGRVPFGFHGSWLPQD